MGPNSWERMDADNRRVAARGTASKLIRSGMGE